MKNICTIIESIKEIFQYGQVQIRTFKEIPGGARGTCVILISSGHQ